ncbi:FBP domain-containing protein [Actinomadura craniellae]|uniref:FBP domain-containing protein n=1 Tax=Actinomadura craniellae TaxID=2231787 RepID=A0A365H4T0_9ACTN|nr:FBP domain-containing protein [Actinomadura craniellae]RAY14101.1 FBP domain-containing protein [Actinomadura craniellae]
MRKISESEIRGSFVNCTKGEVKRLAVPRDLATRPWDDLDFLGWQDPASPHRAYLVAEHGGRLAGVALRRATPHAGHARRSMCSLCLTTHTGDGVSLMTARRTRGDGNSVGAYICTDLACSLYLRGKKDAGLGGLIHESLTLEEKISRTAVNVTEFFQKVTS